MFAPHGQRQVIDLRLAFHEAGGMLIRSPALPIAASLLLAGCVSASSDSPTTLPETPPSASMAGLEPVMGRQAAILTRLFGQPDLDVREGNARKLQFSSQVCVLDAYLYPRSAGTEPVVTWVDARLPDGRDVDRASCVAALRLK